MNAISFDTLAYFDKFKDAGFTEEQARVQTEAMQDWWRPFRNRSSITGQMSQGRQR